MIAHDHSVIDSDNWLTYFCRITNYFFIMALKEDLFEKQSFALKMTSDLREFLTDYIDLKEESGIEFSSFRQLVESLAEDAMSKKKPITVSKPEDQVKINQLVNQLSDMQNVLNSKETEIQELNEKFTQGKQELTKVKQLDEEINELQNEVNLQKKWVNELENELSELREENTQLQAIATKNDNPKLIPVLLNDFEYSYFQTVISNRQVKEDYKSVIQKPYGDMFGPIDTENFKINLSNLFKAITIASSYDLNLITVVPWKTYLTKFQQFKKAQNEPV